MLVVKNEKGEIAPVRVSVSAQDALVGSKGKRVQCT